MLILPGDRAHIVATAHVPFNAVKPYRSHSGRGGRRSERLTRTFTHLYEILHAGGRVRG